MAVVHTNGDGLVTEDNSAVTVVADGVELNENLKDTIVDEESTDSKVEPSGFGDQYEVKEEETSKEQAKTDSVEQLSKKQVSFALATEKDSLYTSNHVDIASENVEEKAVATSKDGRFLKFDVEIGRGSFKTVYKGLDTETGVAVAWCELQPNFPLEKKGKAEQYRFKEEAKMLKTLQHPNILRFYDSWEVQAKGSVRADGRPDRKILVLITELMTSGTLKGYLRRFKDVKPKIIRGWGRQILKGLNYLHTRTPPIIHRDLKCDNIFINGTTGMVKIGDLGLATLKRSHVKTVIGTPEFMAPEMYDEHYDESVDVYAFGMCLLEMTTLQYPYMECTNPGQIYKRVTQGKKPNAIEKVKDPVIRNIIEGCIQEAKENRYTVKDLLALPFFSEVEVIEIKATPSSNDSEVCLVFQVHRKGSKGTTQSQPQQASYETYERLFSLHSDQAQNIALDMVKLHVIHDVEVEAMTKSIQGKVNEVKRARAQLIDTNASSLAMQPSASSVDQDVTSVGSEPNKKPPDSSTATPMEEDRYIPDTGAQPVCVDVTVETYASVVNKLPVPLTDKPQQPPLLLDTASSTIKVTENVEKKNPPSPEITVPTPLLPSSTSLHSSNSPIHRTKEQPLHSRENSSDLSSLAGDSQVSVTKELVPDQAGEAKKQKLRDVDKEIDEQVEVPSGARDTPQHEVSKTDLQAKPPLQQPHVSSQQQPHLSFQQQQKKSRVKGTKDKRPLKLTIVGRDKDLVQCSLTNGGQTITFKFSLDADSSEQIAQGMVSAHHLNENQKDEFKEYADKMIEMARQNEKGIVGGSATMPQHTESKNAIAVSQKEADDKAATPEPFKPPPVEKMDSGHKLLEKSDSVSSVGVDNVIKHVDVVPMKVTIGSQTSIESESQPEHPDSPPASPPNSTVSGEPPVTTNVLITTNSTMTNSVISTQQVNPPSATDLDQCSTQHDVCPTTEYQAYTPLVTTANSDPTISTTVAVSTTASFSLPPVTSMCTPPTITASTTALSSSLSVSSTIANKFTVEMVSEESDDEFIEEPVEAGTKTVSDAPSGQDERMDTSTLRDVTAVSDDDGRIANPATTPSLRSDSNSSFYDDKTHRVTPVVEPTRQHDVPSPEHLLNGHEKPSDKPSVENFAMLSESFSVLMYTVLQVLRNPAMESFVKELDNKYGNGSGPLVVQEYNQDPEYQSLQMRFAEQERHLKEQQKLKMEEFVRKKRSMTASPVGNHKSPSASSGAKARLPKPHDFVTLHMSSQLPYSYQSQQQQQTLHIPSKLPPEGENMERKVKQALMTELGPRTKTSSRIETLAEGENMERKVKQALMTELGPKSKTSSRIETLARPSFQRTAPFDSSRVQSKSSTTLPQLPLQGIPLHQGYQAAPSASTWLGEEFHSGSTPNMEITHEPTVPAQSRPEVDISEFDPIETKKK